MPTTDRPTEHVREKREVPKVLNLFLQDNRPVDHGNKRADSATAQ